MLLSPLHCEADQLAKLVDDRRFHVRTRARKITSVNPVVASRTLEKGKDQPTLATKGPHIP